MGNDEKMENLCCALTNDRDLLKRGINDLLDRVPLEQLKELYLQSLEAAYFTDACRFKL